jgi:hypothetical protein
MGGQNSFANKFNPFAKESFAWQASPIRLLGKMGLQSPGYRMVEYGEPFGVAFEKSGSPAQRYVRQEVRDYYGNMVNPKSDPYPTGPYDVNYVPPENKQNKTTSTTKQQFQMPNTSDLTFGGT